MLVKRCYASSAKDSGYLLTITKLPLDYHWRVNYEIHFKQKKGELEIFILEKDQTHLGDIKNLLWE